MRKDGLITVLILVGLVAGVILGQWIHGSSSDPAGAGNQWMEVGKIILVRPLMLLVLPLVFLSVVVGVTSIGDPSRLGLIGGATLLYYFGTMLAAVILGAVLVTTIAPGVGLSPEAVSSLQNDGASAYQASDVLRDAMGTASEKGLAGAWMNILEQVIPTNFFAELADGRTLGVPHRESATELAREAEQILLDGELAVVTFQRLFKLVQVRCERLLALYTFTRAKQLLPSSFWQLANSSRQAS